MTSGVELRLVLPWDFRTSFPVPLDEAIEQGRLDPSDLSPANLAALHGEHAREATAVLVEIDAVSAARRTNVDPATGKRPRSARLRESLPTRLSAALDRLRHRFELLTDVYVEAFGDEAASAFRQALVARHAGVEVVRDERSRVPRIDVA